MLKYLEKGCNSAKSHWSITLKRYAKVHVIVLLKYQVSAQLDELFRLEM